MGTNNKSKSFYTDVGEDMKPWNYAYTFAEYT